MSGFRGARIAFSFDDAPRMYSPGGGGGSDGCMDAVRVALQGAGVRSCVAFVIGSRAVGHEDALRRWLEAGYELGNHSWSHRYASAIDTADFLADVARCDAFLRGFGGFAGAPRRFLRFPALDAGRDANARATLAKGVRELGYTIVPGSLDVFDHLFESRMDGPDQAAVSARWLAVASASLEFEEARLRKAHKRSVPHLHYGHFGTLSERHLPWLLEHWLSAGAVPCDLGEALQDPFHASYLGSSGMSGRVTCALLGRSLTQRAGNVLARFSERCGFFDQRRLGPLWPYLE